MSRNRLGIAGVVVVALLTFPSTASAGIIDFIIEMSGPQLVGVILRHCKIYFRGGGNDCKSLDDIWKGKEVVLNLEPRVFGGGEFRLAVEGIWFASTGKNSDGDDYLAGRIQMAAIDPMLEIGSINRDGLRLYHGLLGASVNRFFVNDVSDFWKVGLKFRPVGVTVRVRGELELDLAVNIRFYPDKFTRDQFGFPPPITTDRGREWLYGGSFGFAW